MLYPRITALLAPMGLAATLAFMPSAQAAAGKGDTAAIPEVRLLTGEVLPKGHFDGKPVIVSYWASWCPYCARQNPYVQKLWDQAQGKGLEILTVSIDDAESDATNYVDENGYTFPVVMETEALRDVFGKRKIIPYVFVITADGKVAEMIPGEMFEEDVLNFMKYAPGPAAN